MCRRDPTEGEALQLLLIRHGDPDYAVDGLTEVGHAQAKYLAEALADVPIEAVFSSPMGRSQLTARPAAQRKRMSIAILPWLHELDGNYEGGLWAWNLHGTCTFRSSVRMSVDDWQDHVPYGRHMAPIAAELWRHFDEFMEERGYPREGGRYRILKDAWRGTIAFFCHAGVILTLLSHILHVPLPVAYSQFACDPSSVTSLRLEENEGHGVFRLERLNDMSHADLRHG